MPKQKFNFSAANQNMNKDSGSALGATCPKVVKEAPVEEESKLQVSFPKMEIKYIPRSKIRENRKNNYPMEDIETLSISILRFGLQQPITVVYLTDEDKYVIEAGHRRSKVLDKLIQEYRDNEDTSNPEVLLYLKNVKKYESGYPCIVADKISEDIEYDTPSDIVSDDHNVIESEIRLIITNEEIRTTTPQTRAANVKRLSKLYEKLNIDAQPKDRVNINKQIASDLNLKPRQVANYKAINNLIPELKAEFEANNISLKDGSHYSTLSEEDQYLILEMIKNGTKISEEDVKVLKQEKKELKDKITHLEDVLEAKQKELERNIENNTHNPVESEEYLKIQNLNHEMEDTILALKNEVLALKNKDKDEKKKAQSDLDTYKISLKLRAAFEVARSSLQQYMETSKACSSISMLDTANYKQELINLLEE